MTPRFFQKIRDGKTFLIPFRRHVPRVQVQSTGTRTFTSRANDRARAANRAKNRQARRSRKRNRV